MAIKQITSILVAIALGIGGCAKVTVTKVDDPDGQEGIRYYMPRPYIAVHEPFIVGAKVSVVEGQMSTDGRYILITDFKNDLGGILNFKVENNTIPASAVVVSPEAEEGRAEGGEEDSPDKSKPEDDKAPSPPNEKPKAGVLNLAVTNDNDAFAVTPLRRYMDIVWLPDFEEKYVVSGKAGLGNASINLRTGQGWSLIGLDGTADNSRIFEPLLDFYGQTVDGLSKVVQAKLAPMSLIGGLSDGAQSGVEVRDAVAAFKGGTPLSIKITVVKMAAPGLYPILKESEFNDVADLDHDKFKDRVLIPIPPLTRIAFSTYDVVVIEAATITGDSALKLHQYPTGQTEDNPVGEPAKVTPETPEAKLKNAQTRINNHFGTTEPHWVVDLQLKDNNKVSATLRKIGSGTPSKKEDQAKSIIKREIKIAKLAIADSDINVQSE